MPATFSSTSYTPDRLVISLDDVVSRKITVVAGQGALVRGTILGKITASGKYAKSASASSDGSQTPDVVLAHDVDATNDAEALGYYRGVFNSNAITLGTGHTVASITEGLRGKGIDLIAAQVA